MNVVLRRWLLLSVLVLLAVAIGGCSLSRDDQVVEELEVVPAERGLLVSSVTAVGSVRARSEVLLAFGTAGRVSEVLVAAGEVVEQNQVLARLDMADLELQVRNAEAVLAVSRAQLDQLLAGPRAEEVAAARGQVEAMQAALDEATARRDQVLTGATEAEIAAARAAIRSAQANYAAVKAGPSAEQLAAAQAMLDSARATMEKAQAAYDRVKDQANVRMLPESLAMRDATIEMERTQADYNALVNHPTEAELAAAAAEVAQSESQLAQLLKGNEPQVRAAEAAVSAAQAQRDIAQAQLDLLLAGATQEQIAAAKAQVEQAEVALDSARLTTENATLRSPIDGIVAQVDLEVGESLGPHTPVMTLTGDGQFKIEADVDESDIGWMAIGQEVAVDFDAFPGQTLQGRVVGIAPLASVDVGIVSYRVTIEIEPTTLPLRAGMTANTEFVRDQRQGVLLIPNLAISLDPDSGRKIVAKKTETGIQLVEIATGLSTDMYSEVTSGLEEGDLLVITSPSAREQFREMMNSSFLGGKGE
jgi:RND family efflux transporter MFP subunit